LVLRAARGDGLRFAIPPRARVHRLLRRARARDRLRAWARGRARSALLALAFGVGALMGVSRLVLSVRWASDVLAGALLGGGAALACALASETLERELAAPRTAAPACARPNPDTRGTRGSAHR
jgi:membrane-associated phospholipid phosphatase